MQRRRILQWFLSMGLCSGWPRITTAGLEMGQGQVSSASKTGIVYDELFLEHWLETGHPESPARLKAILELMQSEGLLQQTTSVEAFREVEKHILRVHSQEHVDALKQSHAISHKVSSRVVGGALAAVKAVVNGELDNAFCAVRPPGHHAENTGRVEGFCLYNTIAIAARYAQEAMGLGRILIVDWDYHHGNGTESAFYHDPSVLFFSTHDQYAYPGTGDPEKTGAGEAKGYNINVHLPCGTTDQMITKAFEEKLLAVANAFKPELILISAGFDSRIDDLLGCFNVTDDGFIHLTKMMMALADKHCGGKIVSILEGGYNIKGNASAVVSHVKTLAGLI